MRTLAGTGAHVHFTHLSKPSAESLQKVFTASAPTENLADATADQIGVLDLMKSQNTPLEKVCLLDPKAERELGPEDGNGAFEWFLFGVNLFPRKYPIYAVFSHVDAGVVRAYWVRSRNNPFSFSASAIAVQGMILRGTELLS